MLTGQSNLGSWPEPADRPLLARSVLTATVIATVGASLPMFLVSALATDLPALDGGRDRKAVGTAVALFSVTTALLGVVFGRVVARVGWPQVLRWGAASSSAATAAMVVTAESSTALLATIVLAGASFAAVVPATNAALQVVTATSRHRGFAFGVKQSSAPGAIALAGLGLGSLVASDLGWRGTLLVMAAVPLIGALATPRAALVADAMSGPIPVATDDPRGNTASPTLAASSQDVGEAESGIELLLLGLAAFLGTAAAVATVTLLPLTLLTSGVSTSTAGAAVTAAGLASLVGRIAVGALSDRSGREPLALMAMLLLLGASGHLLLAAGTTTTALIGAPIAVGLGWGWPGLFHGHVSGLGVGAGPATGYSMIGLSLGGATGPLLVGGVMELQGARAGWVTAGAMAVIAAALTEVTRRRWVHPDAGARPRLT